MSFISILFALLLEQAKPLAQVNPVHNSVRDWVRWVMRNFDAGKSHHGWLAWNFAVILPTVLVCAVHWLLVWSLGWAVAVVWNIVILYATLGFRQFSHHFTDIRDALAAGDEDQARRLLAQWMRIDASDLPRSEIVRHVIEHSVLSAHRHVFGVFAWYSLLAALGLGPAGAVLYRISEYVFRHASRPGSPTRPPVSAAVQANASKAWNAIDWLPARVTALGFAFVGSFEEAVDSWRQYEAQGPATNDGVVLAATAGAVNVKLGGQNSQGDGQVPQPVHLRAVVGLVWRTVVMWMVFLALLSLARLLG
ncbi:CobD/CbiB family protein [Rhodoferax saidenbachensis]|uniref:Cobalamin biosynthesis protein CobD n=1 Tax=Rhodoferax saidenbachensis TaxID=1484693 RepID=A0A1P8K883_9BURK|nr:CobD/CbiB family protein [Rhodoferax saidenbachensis]APW42211.1 cobalamin biosynthesis protein CbiB [Rhodoferax saidenbachensis]